MESQTKSTGATLTTAPDGTPAHSQTGMMQSLERLSPPAVGTLHFDGVRAAMPRGR